MAIAVTEASLGTVSTSEVEVYTSDQTTDRIVQLAVFVDSCANGDMFAVRAYETINGTLRLIEEWVIGHVAAGVSPHILPPIALGVGYEFRVIKLTGTDRTVRVVRYEVT
jgi:hypothetical protein